MSIPPLVCSTPPPPDQCEDYKDPEEYDLQYNLSQEDDDNDGSEFGFGNFSSYTNYETQTSQSQVEVIITKTIEECKIEQNETIENNTNITITETDDKCEGKLKLDEDMNIEDLNLKVDENPHINFKDIHTDEKKCDSELINNPLTENVVEVSDDVIKIDCEEIACTTTSSCNENASEANDHTNLESDFIIDEEFDTHPSKTDSDEYDNSPKTIDVSNDDGFGDFDDFQYIRSVSKSTDAIDDSENPWQNEIVTSSDFGDFTANFENNEIKSSIVPLENREVSIQSESNDQYHICSSESDFDEFKSSDFKTQALITQEEPKADNSVHVINLQSTDSEPFVMENINKLLKNIFEEEITEPENENEMKLETLLNETWGFLIETDTRQPYIVNWNNSFGQKTLLRALCIDSRNILFGPKWGYSTPKYAANLGSAPLQPQKQTVTANANLTSEAINVEKSVSKPETWTDSFTTDAQEFTYAEALLLDLEHLMATLDQIAHNHSTLKISELLSHACNTEGDNSGIEPRPTDLDVFEATTTSKSEKIYPTSIDIQPVRQINLPETHIFTPTDSETPRSKTTHYDCVPPTLLPHQVSVNHIPQKTKVPLEPVNMEKITKEDEDWEFQDFKSTPHENCITSPANYQSTNQQIDKSDVNPSLLAPIQCSNTAYQTHVLQPIKIEPVIPTLNWPDPGEVKHEFDDFSDFISNSTWTEKTISEADSNIIIKSSITDAKSENVKLDKINHVETINDNSGPDDDFNTFQFALPSGKQLDAFVLKSSSNDTSLSNQMTSNSVILTSESKIEHVFRNDNIVKSDAISSTNVTKLNESFVTNLNITSDVTAIGESNQCSRPSQSKILQPTPANINISLFSNQQKSAQILQPLSLESYSQINWPGPGIDLQDLSRFNPVDTLHSLKSDLTSNGPIKNSPIHNNKNTSNNQVSDDDVWGEFVSSKPKVQPSQTKKNQIHNDDDEWTDFVSSSSIKPQNGLNTISLNVHTNSNIQKISNQGKFKKTNDQIPVDIPSLNYITPKTNSHKTYNDRHFQNL